MKGCYPVALTPHVKHERPSEDDVAVMIRRMEHGLDIWTGRPLTGQDADNWVRIQEGVPEQLESLSEEEKEEVAEAFNWLRWSPMLLENQ